MAGSVINTSKGLNFYFVNTTDITMSANASNADGSSAMSQPNIQNPPSSFCTGNCQITTDIIHLPPLYTGSVTVNVNGVSLSPLLTEEINGFTGGCSGPLSNMMSTPSQIGINYNLSYGFFDAQGSFSTDSTNLSDQDQIYAYLTPLQNAWMGDLAAANAVVNNAPFSSFVLPGAHDSGTFDLSAVNDIVSTAAEFEALLPLLAEFLPAVILELLSSQAVGVITGEAVTQKDTITTMLNLGCRYFDFRPGSMPSPISEVAPDIYHIHSAIPFYPFNSFLVDILTWLLANPTEIVVISLAGSGFIPQIAPPSATDIENILATAQTQTDSTSIQIGVASDLQSSYSNLISQNKRLFFLNPEDGIFGALYSAKKYDSYNGNYATAQPGPIIKALEAMSQSGQAGQDYTVLQLQGTATAQSIKAIVTSLITSLSSAYEPLISTKALFDSTTYSWVSENVTTNLLPNQLVVLLNDFVDNALSVVASNLTLERCNLNKGTA